MRVTTQMLNESSRKAGLPVNRTSLLNYVNGRGGNGNALLSALQSKASGQVRSADKVKYEKLERAAEGLGEQADRFTAEGEDSLWEKAKNSGDYTEVWRELDSLVDGYNSMISILESMPGTMNDFYRRSMQELVAEDRDALSGIGITVDKQGKLQVDQEKLEAADRETVEKILGREGKFTPRLSFLAGRVEDNAESNVTSAASGYSAKGDITGTHINKYDHRG